MQTSRQRHCGEGFVFSPAPTRLGSCLSVCFSGPCLSDHFLLWTTLTVSSSPPEASVSPQRPAQRERDNTHLTHSKTNKSLWKDDYRFLLSKSSPCFLLQLPGVFWPSGIDGSVFDHPNYWQSLLSLLPVYMEVAEAALWVFSAMLAGQGCDTISRFWHSAAPVCRADGKSVDERPLPLRTDHCTGPSWICIKPNLQTTWDAFS